MKKQNAFTLAELLVSILIISVILTLLAPVITKRAKENISINGGSTNKINTRLFIYNKSDSNCSEISGVNNSLSCNFTIPSGVNRINAIAVSGGGGGAGATQPSIEYGKKLTVANATAKTSKTQELTITNGMKNIVISELIGSGAGGGGASWISESSGPQSQADCDPYNALFIPAAYNGTGGKNLCATKFNAGDPKGPTIPSIPTTGALKYNIVRPNQSCTAQRCCWSGGTTSSDCEIESGTVVQNYTNYSSCDRTVCTYWAGVNLCLQWAPEGTKAGDWRLPTKEEASGWLANMSNISSTSLGPNGMQFCDSYRGKTNFLCKYLDNSCFGSFTDSCHPQAYWVRNEYLMTLKKTTGVYPMYGESTGSVRCVYDGTGSGVQKFSALSGGGGGAGAYIKNYQIPNDVISSNIGGKIKLFSAAGGSGGNSASSQGSSASNGSNGNTSYIEIYDKDNVLKWGIRALGGNYGYGASSTDYGNGGAQTSANSCQLYENGIWKSINCTGVGIKGTNGNKVESASSTNTATGGSGGGSMYNSSTAIGGGSGGSISSANGYNGSVYGAGGGGATIVFDSSNNVTKGIGGNGANGVAEITYDLVRQAAGGGGGGGGAFIRVEKIKVTSGKEYTIKVASGGAAGSVATKGSDGGVTSATFDSVTYTLSGGKGGQIGTSSTDTSNVIQGIGGLGGIVSSNVSDTTNIEYKNGLKGDDGNTYTTTTGFVVSNGGNGGTSGLDTKGGCGGLFIDSSICTNTNVNGTSVNFVSPNQIFDTAQYGAAGAGGSGGGWSEDTFNYPNSGGGSQGQSGYVYINWVKYKS